MQSFLVEYYDVRDRDSVLENLNGQTMFDMRFWVSSVDDSVYDPPFPLTDVKLPPGLPSPFYGPLVPQLSIMIPTSPMIPNPAYYSPAIPSPPSAQMYYPSPYPPLYPHMPPHMAYHPFEYPLSPPPLDVQSPSLAQVATITVRASLFHPTYNRLVSHFILGRNGQAKDRSGPFSSFTTPTQPCHPWQSVLPRGKPEDGFRRVRQPRRR